jgi:hypothetical protein
VPGVRWQGPRRRGCGGGVSRRTTPSPVVAQASFGLLRVSRHAVDRYRARVESRAPVPRIVAAMVDAHFRQGAQPPGGLDQVGPVAAIRADGWIVAPGWACPLKRDDDAWVVVTCMRRARKSKAHRRQLRDEARGEMFDA